LEGGCPPPNYPPTVKLIQVCLKHALASEDGRVPFLSDTHEGSTHDKPIADATPYPLPLRSELLQDLGFQGYTLDGVQITQPHKKPRGKPLTDKQKEENKAISRRRVRVEHIINSIKRCRILKEPIRLWKDTVRDMVLAVCVGLHNFRLRLNPWLVYDKS
jgi:hypothetical protein